MFLIKDSSVGCCYVFMLQGRGAVRYPVTVASAMYVTCSAEGARHCFFFSFFSSEDKIITF